MVKLNININISNRSFILIGGIIIAYNPSGTANPAIMGHSANEISGLTLSCVTKENSCAAAFCSITCDSGYTMTGGGYDTYYGTNVDFSSPAYYSETAGGTTDSRWPGWYRYETANTWYFYDYSFTGGYTHVFARCCKIA